MRVLVACEMGGRVRSEFAARGWEAYSCDILPDESAEWCERPGGEHYEGDVRDLLGLPCWDLIVAHPPCTNLSLAGANRWREKRADGRQDAAAEFFRLFVDRASDGTPTAIENPKGDMTRRYREADQYIHSWQFGGLAVKATGLWLHNLPALVPTVEVQPEDTFRLVTGGGSWRTDKAAGRNPDAGTNWEDSQGRKRRHILRSLTDVSIAAAMAGQWGSYIEGLQEVAA